jgi:hypothetical protein
MSNLFFVQFQDLLRECQLQIERIMDPQIPDIKAANPLSYSDKFTGSENNLEVYQIKHVIDSDDSQQNDSSTDVQDLHF